MAVTIVMSDIRGYYDDRRARRPDASRRASSTRHRAEMNRAIIGHGGTVMQYVGDAVMAVFGAPEPPPTTRTRTLAAAWDDARRRRTR